MASVMTKKEVYTVEDFDGNMTQTTKETTTKYERSMEPDYIKIYTDMWCEFNQIPVTWRPLFMQLVTRMSYCNLPPEGGEGGQLVNTGKPWGDAICKALGWKVTGKTNNQLMQGLRELCKCKAIKKINRGVYQINPQYAGKGEWKYNPKEYRGGLENLVASFNFATGEVDIQADWSDDGTDTEYNRDMRRVLGLNEDKGSNATLISTYVPANAKASNE